MADKELKNVAAVERALTILDAFRKGDGALSLAELADRTGLYKSTILRLLQTLEQFDYVTRTEDGLYRIGSKPLRLAALYQDSTQPHDLIVPLLRQLVQASGESASFNVRRGDVRVCVYRVDSPHPIRDHMRPGDVYPLDRGAAGRVLAAFTHPDDPAYAGIRSALVCSSVGSVDPDSAGVSAPVFGAQGTLAGALAISGPKSRFDDAAVRRFSELLLDAATRLTTQMGGDAGVFAKAKSA